MDTTEPNLFDLKEYFSNISGSLSSNDCKSTYSVHIYDPLDPNQLVSMIRFLKNEYQITNQEPLGSSEINKPGKERLTLFAIDNDNHEIVSYLQSELIPSNIDNDKFIFYIGNSYTGKNSRGVGLSILLRYFFMKMVIDFKDKCNIVAMGSYTIASESANLMVNKLGFKKWMGGNLNDKLFIDGVKRWQIEFDTYMDTFLVIKDPEDWRILNQKVDEETKKIGECKLKFQKSNVSCRYCMVSAKFECSKCGAAYCGIKCRDLAFGQTSGLKPHPFHYKNKGPCC
jgi:hypothetical protein